MKAKSDPKTEKEIKVFDIFNGMNLGNKLYSKEDCIKGKLSLYMLLTHISTNPALVHIANDINRNYKYYTANLYNAYLFVFLQMKDMRLKCTWMGRDKKITSKPLEVALMMNYFKVKEAVAKRYVDYFDKEEIAYFKEIYAVAGTTKLTIEDKN